jgi:hypothetical protein
MWVFLVTIKSNRAILAMQARTGAVQVRTVTMQVCTGVMGSGMVNIQALIRAM